ncbi:hypothetical protein KCU71_g185, partial [Aureobasidium melanogenum]
LATARFSFWSRKKPAPETITSRENDSSGRVDRPNESTSKSDPGVERIILPWQPLNSSFALTCWQPVDESFPSLGRRTG